MIIYNTLTKTLEEFHPLHDPVRLYVCGVTPYDTTHLGHAFTFVIFDTLVSYLKWRGYRVKYVQNITDVDDDILRRAAELGEPYQEVGNRYLAEFLGNMEQLNVLSPEVRPRATEEISQMADMVKALLERGAAYRLDDKIYFRVNYWPEYGSLSGLAREKMLARVRQQSPEGNEGVSGKEDPLDFVLWQASGLDEPSWDTVIGSGRPGWHIECSAMSLKHLGLQLDIHGGGRDLIFPHHESERSQSESFTGLRPFARYWCHVGLVHLEGQPMSKSLGNMRYVSELLRSYSPAAVRFLLLSHHYREDWEFNEQELKESAERVQPIMQGMSLNSALARGWEDQMSREFEAEFREAMDQDLNTPLALEAVSRLARNVVAESAGGAEVAIAQSKLVELGNLLGLVPRMQNRVS